MLVRRILCSHFKDKMNFHDRKEIQSKVEKMELQYSIYNIIQFVIKYIYKCVFIEILKYTQEPANRVHREEELTYFF